MSKKPKISVRRPPADAEKVDAFISGGAGEKAKRPDVQTSKQPGRRQTTIYFDQATIKRLKIYCAANDSEMSATVNAAVVAYLDAVAADDGQ